MSTELESLIVSNYLQRTYPTPDITESLATEMAAGTEPEGAKPMSLRQFAETAADAPAGLLKGAIQGTAGLGGDVEMIASGVKAAFPTLESSQVTLFPVINAVRQLAAVPGDALDRFLKAVEEETILPTTEDVKKWLDANVGPLVPEGADAGRREAAKTAEFVGELGGAGQTIIEGTKAAGRGVQQAVKAVSDMMPEDSRAGLGIMRTPPTGAVTLGRQAATAPKSELGFYSAVEDALLNIQQDKGTGAQFLSQISKTAGVKPDELKWTGLDEFLKGKKSVTKAEVQDYLNSNRVDVQEVRLSDQIDPEDVRAYMEDEAGYGLTYEEALDDLRTGEPSTRFSQYTLPGGENYREILLTLPQKTVNPIASGKSPATMLFERDMMEKYGADRFPSIYNQLSPNEIDRYEMLVREDRNAAKTESLLQDKRTTFRSSHFDQPNILAHLRVNDRTVDGKKTLFVEEIQSDWHQAGRKKGYKSEIDPNENASLVKQYDSLTAKRRQIEGIVATGDDASPVTQNAIQNLNQINAELERISDRLSEIRTAASEGVPDAPFKTSWHELTLKRAIQEASEKGYEQVAFTTGKTQAERYDLSNRIKTIVYSEPDANGRRTVTAITPDGDRILGDRYTISEIEDNVGKEMAEKMEKSAGEFDARTGTYALSGLDLETEHKGMKGFYDNILPKSLDKLGKKFGAKVGKTEMDGVEVWQMDITPQMRESVTTKGQPLFAIPAIGAGLLGAGMMQEEEQF